MAFLYPVRSLQRRFDVILASILYFDNAFMQVDSNLQDIESLNNVLDILQNQDSVSSSDIEGAEYELCL